MEAVTWREHAGVRYLHVCYTGCTTDEALEVLEETARVITAEPPGVRMLVDVRGTSLDARWVSRAKTVALNVFRAHDARMTVVGANAVQAGALRGLHRLGQLRTLTAHPTVEDALAALALP